MKKILLFIVLISFCLIQAGCPKLVRTKKKEYVVPVYTYEDKGYEKVELSFRIYKKNFIYWKTSHDELVDNLDASDNKRVACFEYILDYLDRMKNTLPTEYQIEIAEHVDEYMGYEADVKEHSIRSAKQELLRKRLNTIKKDIVKEFSIHKEKIKELFNE